MGRLTFIFVVFWGGMAAAEPLREGDLVFQTSRSAQSQAIAVATKSPYTHMGIYVLQDGKPMVLEAVQPVKLTPYAAWKKRGVGGKVAVRRLADTSPLTPEVIAKMREVGRGFLGKSYDLGFEWSDERLYCSELVYKVYDRGAGIQLGKLQKLGDFDASHPLVQKALFDRYSGEIPIEMDVISPQSIFDDPRLVTVTE